jgi:hypothetical protein
MITEQDLKWLLSNTILGDDHSCIVIVPYGYNILAHEAFGMLGLNPVRACKYDHESSSYHYLLGAKSSRYLSFRSVPKIFKLNQTIVDLPSGVAVNDYDLEQIPYSHKQ